MEVDGALANAQYARNLARGFAAGRPGEALTLALVEVDVARPYLVACAPAEPRLDDGRQALEVDGFCDVVIGAETPAAQLAVAVTESGEEDKRNALGLWRDRRQ